ncbi:MAG TPA: transposase [Candidatus Paceibacterota bacterium]
MNRGPIVTGEYYHVFNHGVEGSNVFNEPHEFFRFLLGMKLFNSQEPIDSIRAYFESGKDKNELPSRKRLVDIVCYCLNPNHYHMVLKQLRDGGIAEFMKRLNGAYTWYFNAVNKRKGALFRGKYKSKHISDNDYLLHTVAYVNLNNRVHNLSGRTAVKSSWEEYVSGKAGLCEKSIILEQFGSLKEYEKFALGSLELSLERKKEEKELASLLLE